jgi:hypothetical protein
MFTFLSVWGFRAAVAYSSVGHASAQYSLSVMVLLHGPRLLWTMVWVLWAFVDTSLQ